MIERHCPSLEAWPPARRLPGGPRPSSAEISLARRTPLRRFATAYFLRRRALAAVRGPLQGAPLGRGLRCQAGTVPGHRTRYDKRPVHFLGAIYLTGTATWLN